MTASPLSRFVVALAAMNLVAATVAVASPTMYPRETSRAAPGTLLRIWPLEGGVRPGYKGYRVLYRSTGVGGQPVAVTGAVMFPAERTAEGVHRDIVAWAHPTTGVASKCAPTLLPDLAGSVQGVDRLADRGYVIVATDYVGLGTEDHHPYLIGQPAAHAVLDIVRAVRQLKDADAGSRFAVWGHSQGGHSALFTGAVAPSYAPELQLMGVAAAAPATDLLALFSADRETASGRSLTSMALLSWARVFKLPLDEFVFADARHHFDALANDCIETLSDFFKEDHDEKVLERQFLRIDPLQNARVREIMAGNSTGALPSGTPVFLSQGTADDLVRPRITHTYMQRICSGGAKVKLHTMQGGGHMFAGRDSAYAAVEWISARFKGASAPNDCR